MYPSVHCNTIYNSQDILGLLCLYHNTSSNSLCAFGSVCLCLLCLSVSAYVSGYVCVNMCVYDCLLCVCLHYCDSVNMCIARVCVSICDYVYVYLSVFLYVYMCLSVCVSLCISVFLSACICVWGRWCIHVASGAYSHFSHFFYNVLVDATHGFNKISHSPLPFILGCNMNHTPFSSQAHFFLLLTKGFGA